MNKNIFLRKIIFSKLPFLVDFGHVDDNGDIIFNSISKFKKIIKFSDLVPTLYEVLDQEEFFGVWLENFPFCVLSFNAQDHILREKGKSKGEKKKECRGCRFFKECSGFPKGYFKKYGSREIKPIFDIPQEVMIELESQCNFRCKFCFNKISFAKNGRKSEQLSFDFIKKIIDSIKKAGIKTVRFTGGEPLLHSKITEIMEYAKKKDLEVRLNTNGSLINKKNAKKFKGIVDNVLIPIESASDSEESEITGSKDALKKKIETIRLLKKANIQTVRIGTVATKENIRNFRKIFNLVKKLPVDEWELYRPISSKSELIGKDVEKLVSNIIQARKKSRISISLANAIPFCSVKNINEINSISSGALFDEGHSRIVVDPRKFAKPHYFINKNVGDPLDVLSAWNHPFMKKMRQLNFMPRECKKCNFKYKCRGGSRFAAYLESGKYNSRDPLADCNNLNFLKK